MSEYHEFLQLKTDYGADAGLDPVFMPDFLFDFQMDLVEWATRKGRAAIFADCGLGKTCQQLVWAQNIIQHTNKPVLILTPLAVSYQTIQEADKFDIEAYHATDVKHQMYPTIHVTNYEKLHHFEATDYAGVVCDECFVAGTPVDTTVGMRAIETIIPGDLIWTAAGLQRVKATHRRHSESLVVTSIRGRDVISSENHPFFTDRGWIKARELKEGDCVIYTTEAMRMVQEAVDGKATETGESVLRDILLSEMENEPTGDCSEGPYQGDPREDWQEDKRVASIKRSNCQKRDGTYPPIKSNRATRGKSKNLKAIERDRAQTESQRWKWQANSQATKNAMGSIGRRMAIGTISESGQEAAGIPNTLQDRHSQSKFDDSDRSRRLQSC